MKWPTKKTLVVLTCQPTPATAAGSIELRNTGHGQWSLATVRPWWFL